jgi:hypothetical protein
VALTIVKRIRDEENFIKNTHTIHTQAHHTNEVCGVLYSTRDEMRCPKAFYGLGLGLGLHGL